MAKSFFSAKMRPQNEGKDTKIPQNTVKDTKRPSRTLSLSNLFRKRSKAPLSALPVVEEKPALTKSATLPEPRDNAVAEENATKQEDVVQDGADAEGSKTIEIPVQETPVEPTPEKGASEVKTDNEKPVRPEDLPLPASPVAENHNLEVAAIATSPVEVGEKIQPEEISPSSESKAVEEPTAAPTVCPDEPVVEAEQDTISKVQTIPDSAIELPEVASKPPSEIQVAENGALSEAPGVVPEVVTEKPKEVPKPSRRSSIFGRIGSLRLGSKPSTKRHSSVLPSTSENVAKSKPTTPPKKALDTKEPEYQTELRAAKLRQQGQRVSINNAALAQKVQEALHSPKLPAVTEKEEQGDAKKVEITGSGFGQDCYF